MDGDGGSKNNKKGVRRPMNAFLIFCKRQRSKVREKNPQMDNRSITRVLGDIWAKMDKEEKASFTILAKQYKDAFMKANPGYKWHSSDRVHGGGGATSKVLSKQGSGAAGTTTSKSDKFSSTALSSSKHQHYQNIHVSTDITPGKLADPGQMGGLNLLLKAGKESELMQSKSKSTTATTASSISSLFSFTPISLPPPTKPHFSPSSSSSSLSHMASGMTSQKSKQYPVSSSSSSLLEVPGVESATANSALLQLAEMCTTELYSGADERTSGPLPLPQSAASVAPPKKRARQWHNESPSPLADDNGRKRCQGLSPLRSDSSANIDTKRKAGGGGDIALDLSQTQPGVAKEANCRRGKRGQKGNMAGKGGNDTPQTWSRKRKLSSSATDSVSSSASPSVSPVTVGGVGSVYVSTRLDEKKGEAHRSHHPEDIGKLGRSSGRREFQGPLAENNHCSPEDSSKITLLLTPPLPSQQLSSPSSEHDKLNDETKYTRVHKVPSHDVSSSVAATSMATSSVLTGHCPKPFTQGKVKKKWAQRMMVEAQQEEELALAKRESQQCMKEPAPSPSTPHNLNQSSTDVSTVRQRVVSQCVKLETNNDVKVEDSKQFPPPWGKIDVSRNPLPPPPPINTSFPLPVSGAGDAHRSHTLYKALTSEMSPPRHRPVAAVTDLHNAPSSSSSSPVRSNNIFDPITACGKKFTDHIVEQLVLHGSSGDKRDNMGFSPSVSSSPPMTRCTPAFTSQTLRSTGESSKPCEENAGVKPGMGLWANVPTHFPMDSRDKSGGWASVETEKKGLDSRSFPASSLFEKVARKVSGPQRDVVSPQPNGSCSLGNTVKVENKFGDAMSSSACQSQPARSDLVAEVNATSMDMYAADSLASGVRKSRRANRGQKYQALIKEGIIQPSKERLALRNQPTKSSHKEEMEHPVQESDLIRMNKNRERATPSPKTVKNNRASPVQLIDFKNDTGALPLSQQQQELRKQFDRKPCINSGDGGSGLDARVDRIGSNPFFQHHHHGQLVYDKDDKNLGASLKLTPHMNGWCQTRIPLTSEELASMDCKKTGCAKRKMRRIRILHITNESRDLVKSVAKDVTSDSLVKPVSSLSDRQATTVKEESINCLQDQQAITGASSSQIDLKPVLNSSLHSLGASCSKPADKLDTGRKCSSDMMFSPLHLLTNAAMQSERAVYPTVPQPAMNSLHVVSVPSSPVSSTNRVSPRPASVPFVEDINQASRTDNCHPMSSSGHHNSPVPSSWASEGASILESPSKGTASTALLSLSLSPSLVCPNPQKNTTTQNSSMFSSSLPSSPNTVTTLPIPPPSLQSSLSSSLSFHQSVPSSSARTKKKAATTAPTVLNVPAITCSSGALSIRDKQMNNTKNDPSLNIPGHRPLHHPHHHQMSHHKQAMMQHSQKLVRLLTNTDDGSPFGDTNRRSLDVKGNAYSGYSHQDHAKRAGKSGRIKTKKPTESLPIIQFNKGVSAFAEKSSYVEGVEARFSRPQSRKRPLSGSHNNNNNKKKRRKPLMSQQTAQAAQSQSSLNVGRGLPGSKLFPSSIIHTAAPVINQSSSSTSHNTTNTTTTSTKKHKPTIWDHLSSQCSLPMKTAAKTSKAPPHMKSAMTGLASSPLPIATPGPVLQQMVTPCTTASIPLVSAQTPVISGIHRDASKAISGNTGSDTDSANEDDEKALCIVEGDQAVCSSDTDSAEESEFESSASKIPHKLCSSTTKAAASLVLNLDGPPVSSRNSLPHSPSINAGHKSLLSGLPSTLAQRFSYNQAAIKVSSPSIVPPVTASLGPVPSTSSSSRPSFVPVSSITLPSDLPEGDQDILSTPLLSTGRDEPSRNILLATTVATPSASQVTVKTIAPTSPYPSPHVADLSSSCITLSSASSLPPSTPAVTTAAATGGSYGNILLSTLQNPHYILVPKHRPSTTLVDPASPTTSTALSSPPIPSEVLRPSSSIPASSSSSTKLVSSNPFTTIIPVPPATANPVPIPTTQR